MTPKILKSALKASNKKIKHFKSTTDYLIVFFHRSQYFLFSILLLHTTLFGTSLLIAASENQSLSNQDVSPNYKAHLTL